MEEKGESKRTILVVEDDIPLREAISFKLAKDGYKVIQATSGEEALDIVRKTIPDFVWLDMLLPGMDGLEVLKKLRNDESTKNIPVIVVSASCGPEKINKAKNLNICEYIVKSDNRLEDIIEKVKFYIK